MKAINIKWDTDGDEEILNELPTEMEIPKWLEDKFDRDDQYFEEISEWLSDQTGFCHFGFDIVQLIS